MARILVVDDEEGVRAFLAETLEAEGHEVTRAGDGAAAVELLDRSGFDVVVTDLKMPRMSGMELLERVRAEQPDAEVIMLTAHGSVDSAVEAMKRGAFDYLQKPVGSPAELRLLVARALERRRLISYRDSAARSGDSDVELTWGDPAMTPVVEALRRVAATSATVLLLGESGSGKEVAARAVHRWSERSAGPFVAVNCAALTDTLLESELFGHERGAFTGAHAQRRGRIELAAGGTFFLDEIGELKPDLQAKLLRVLQERRFERVGGTRTLSADVRWIAATNRDLREMMTRGTFREDLYHRLAVFPVRLPALRERKSDIRPLAQRLHASIAAELGRPAQKLSEAALARLEQEKWPGNIRALRNALERAAILAGDAQIETDHLLIDAGAAGAAGNGAGAAAPGAAAPPVAAAQNGGTLADLERVAIEDALQRAGGNRKQAAAALGIGVRTLYDKLKRYGMG